MKDAGLRIRIEPELREEFVELCRKNDVPASQVLRAFMRDFIKNNRSKTKPLNSLNAKKALR
jgi:antitoxin component of RelBE/YafQ-DinJ toxin-antitoxin module